MELARLPSQTSTTGFKNQIENHTGRALGEHHVPLDELSVGDLCQLLQVNPYAVPQALALAERLRTSGKITESIQLLRALIRIDNGFETLFALGMAQAQNEDWQGALKSLQQAALVAPDESPHLANLFKSLGNIHVRFGDGESARDLYHKALRLEPSSDVLRVNLGTLEIQQGDWQSAIQRFREALPLNSKNDRAWVGLAICHRHFGDLDLAWANLEVALSHNPRNEAALTLAIDWAGKDGKEARVRELLREFLIADGWNIQFSLTFIWLSAVAGDQRAAEMELDRVLTMAPDCEAAWHLREKLETIK